MFAYCKQYIAKCKIILAYCNIKIAKCNCIRMWQLSRDRTDPGAVQENVVIIYTESAAVNCMPAAVRRTPEDLNR